MQDHLAKAISLLGQEELIYQEKSKIEPILHDEQILSDLSNIVGEVIEADNRRLQPRYRSLATKEITNYLLRHPTYKDYSYLSLNDAISDLTGTVLSRLFY